MPPTSAVGGFSMPAVDVAYHHHLACAVYTPQQDGGRQETGPHPPETENP